MHTEHNYMKLQVKATAQNEGFIRCAVGAFCVTADPTVEQINDIKTAVSEAVSNCVVHGYEQGEGEITVEATLSNDEIVITVCDEGVGVADIEKALQPFYTTKPDQERSGMGFTVMQTFMDSLQVTHNTPRGLKVSMTKRLGCK